MRSISERSGSLSPLEGDAEAFIPHPLPPKGGLDFGPELLSLLSEAGISLGRLYGISGLLPEPDLFVMMYIKKEAVWSSQIEGTQASLMDVLEFEAEALRPDAPRDVDEVVNYIGAMNLGLQRIAEGREIDMELIKELHSRLMKGSRGGELAPGEFRDIQNWIGPHGCSLSEAVFVPPPPDEMIKALKELVDFIRKDKGHTPLVKAALVHSQFESIHPFLDGKGRMGRLLMILLIVKEGYLNHPLLYISHYLRMNRSIYYEKLQRTREGGEFEDWVIFFLRGVKEVSEDSSRKCTSILKLVDEDKKRTINELGRNGPRGARLIDGMLRRPVIDVNGMRSITGLSYQNANKLASQLEDIGILEEITGQKRNRIFEYKGYLELLEG